MNSMYVSHLTICSFIHSFIHSLFQPNFKMIFFLERHEGKERNIDRLPAPPPAPTLYAPQLGIKPATFWCIGWYSNKLSHPSRAQQILFKHLLYSRHCSRTWGTTVSEIDKNLCPHGIYILLKRNRQYINWEYRTECPVVGKNKEGIIKKGKGTGKQQGRS